MAHVDLMYFDRKGPEHFRNMCGRVPKTSLRAVPASLKKQRNKTASITLMYHTLCKLRDMSQVREVLEESVRITRDTIVIVCSPFHDAYMNSLGLRYCWAEPRAGLRLEPEAILRHLSAMGLRFTYRYCGSIQSSEG